MVTCCIGTHNSGRLGLQESPNSQVFSIVQTKSPKGSWKDECWIQSLLWGQNPSIESIQLSNSHTPCDSSRYPDMLDHEVGSISGAKIQKEISAQAWRARELCVSIAVSLVAPTNCFSLFRVADECTLPQLQSVCLATGLTKFSQAVEIDKAGFCSLDLNQLLQFLGNDHMQVISTATKPDPPFYWILYWHRRQRCGV